MFAPLKPNICLTSPPNFVSETFVSEALIFKSSTLSPAAMFVIVKNAPLLFFFPLLLLINLLFEEETEALREEADLLDDEDEADDIIAHRAFIIAFDT